MGQQRAYWGMVVASYWRSQHGPYFSIEAAGSKSPEFKNCWQGLKMLADRAAHVALLQEKMQNAIQNIALTEMTMLTGDLFHTTEKINAIMANLCFDKARNDCESYSIKYSIKKYSIKELVAL